jgi:hypothetical protein
MQVTASVWKWVACGKRGNASADGFAAVQMDVWITTKGLRLEKHSVGNMVRFPQEHSF